MRGSSQGTGGEAAGDGDGVGADGVVGAGDVEVMEAAGRGGEAGDRGQAGVGSVGAGGGETVREEGGGAGMGGGRVAGTRPALSGEDAGSADGGPAAGPPRRARLGFPAEYRAEMAYRLLGNSLHVGVVAALLGHLWP